MTRQRKITGLPFKPEMVRANLDDRKTQTRRTRGLQKVNECPDDWVLTGLDTFSDGNEYFLFEHKSLDIQYSLICPYGQTGDILYVKETYMEPVLYDGAEQDYYYAADYENPKEAHLRDRHIGGKWKPGMFMPQSVARIWMEIVDSYPERIQDITNTGAIDEGVMIYDMDWVCDRFPSIGHLYKEWEKRKEGGVIEKPPLGPSPSKRFEALWIDINGQDTWDRNIWVWVVKYKILSKTGKPEGI